MVIEYNETINVALAKFKNAPVYPFLAGFGASTLIYIGGKCLLSFLNGIRIHFWSRVTSINLKEKFGRWAIVTGCTNGIGRAMCFELASKGLNIVLIARNPKYLEELSNILETQYHVQTMSITADFKNVDVYESIKHELKPIERDLGILINNVAMAQDKPEYYARLSDTMILDSINTNITSVSLMSKIALEAMTKRNCGAIINVSSFAGVYAAPLISIYSATKAFVNHFSRNLALEYGSKGIYVQNLIPLGVKTNMLKRVWDKDTVNSPLTPTADVYAYNAINSLCRTRQTSGYWRHSLAQWFTRLLPPSFVDTQMYGLMRRSMDQKKQQILADHQYSAPIGTKKIL